MNQRVKLKAINKEEKNELNLRNIKGITLIALVVTIVVLLILTGITISTLFGENGIINAAKRAADDTAKDQNNTEQGIQNLTDEMNEALELGVPKVKLSDGTSVTLTKENFGQYLGKVVTNYTPTTTTVQGATVSTTYRLYYVDFDGKYGEKNSIYLKADCTSSNKNLTLDSTSIEDEKVKLKELNPALYAQGVTSPKATDNSMKAVVWLTNTDNWKILKEGVIEDVKSKINYVVGAPSLEMMIDSYNEHYRLKGDTPDTSTLSESTDRVKLFYKYPYDTSNYGYGVGPCNFDSTVQEYSTYTSKYSVKSDTNIDGMYYPGSSKYYWLASPSANGSNVVMSVNCSFGGYVTNSDYNFAFSPLVSLKSNVSLELGA